MLLNDDCTDLYGKFSDLLHIRNLVNITVSVTANTENSTNVDWSGVNQSKIIYSWLWWSNQLSDAPKNVNIYYGQNQNNRGCIITINHIWSVTQIVNLKIFYLYID